RVAAPGDHLDVVGGAAAVGVDQDVGGARGGLGVEAEPVAVLVAGALVAVAGVEVVAEAVAVLVGVGGAVAGVDVLADLVAVEVLVLGAVAIVAVERREHAVAVDVAHRAQLDPAGAAHARHRGGLEVRGPALGDRVGD